MYTCIHRLTQTRTATCYVISSRKGGRPMRNTQKSSCLDYNQNLVMSPGGARRQDWLKDSRKVTLTLKCTHIPQTTENVATYLPSVHCPSQFTRLHIISPMKQFSVHYDHTNQSQFTLTNTPRSTVTVEKLAIIPLVKNFPAFYGTGSVTTMLKTCHSWSQSWFRWVQSIPSHTISIKSALILSPRSSSTMSHNSPSTHRSPPILFH
jgi:hypothetical protein